MTSAFFGDTWGATFTTPNARQMTRYGSQVKAGLSAKAGRTLFGDLPCVNRFLSHWTCMWDLVEYLSYQRVMVQYHYYPSHFTVTFPRMNMQSVQNILDEWVHAGALELEPA